MLNLLLFQKIAQLFVVIFLGWLVVKIGLLKTEDSRCLSMILLYVITPCVFINAFQAERNPEMLSMVAFSAVLSFLFIIVLLAAGHLAARWFHMDVVEEGSIIYPNSGNMAIPLVNAVFGGEWVIFVTLYNMIQNLFVWSCGRMLISGEKKFSLRALLMNVNILAILAGSLLFFLNIRLPEILHNALSSVGDMIGPAAMLIVGMLIADLKPEDLKNCRRIWKPVLFRLVLLPLLLILLARVLRLSQLHPEGETLALVALIPSFAPSANTVSQFSQIYGRDAKYAGLINAATMLLCIITLPLMVSIYQL